MASEAEAKDAVDATQHAAVGEKTTISDSHGHGESAPVTEPAEGQVNAEMSTVDAADEETSSDLSEREHAERENGQHGDDYQQQDDGGYEHNEDEYDPANPSHGDEGYEYDPADPDLESARAQDGEYDPENPGDGFNKEFEHPVESAGTDEPTEKRKATSSVASSPSLSVSSVARSPKRQRAGDARGPYKPDQRGLCDAVWDRLLDFELSGQFRIAQVSRASFASIATLPEFAQSSIVARFSRTPMKDIRDKNALIMRLYREYLAENPLVESLPPVSVFVDDAASDPGLFAFGYAPPMPRTGVSTMKIPFRLDKPGTFTTTSAFSQAPAKVKAVSEPQELDEFGRVVKKLKTEGTQPPALEAKSESATSAAPRVNEPTSTPTKAPSAAVGKPSDPRRRRNEGSPVDPHRASTATSTEPRVRHIEKSDVYNRLPPAVRSRLDALIRANRLPEAINDNVLSRLKHLPESTALIAVDKFAEADLGQVSNLNGFLVGIINRVQERGPQPSDPRGPSPSHATAPATTTYRQHPAQASHQQPQQQHYHHVQPQQQPYEHAPVQHQPYTGGAPLHDRQSTHVPMARPQHPEHASSHFHESLMPPPAAHAPGGAAPQAQVGYDRQYAPAPAYAMEAPPAAPAGWQPMHAPTDPRLHYQHQGAGAPTGGRFSSHPSIDRAVASLPVSVQNHLVSLVNSRSLSSLEELSEKCYETLAQLSEGLANDVLTRFGSANLTTVRNRSGFLMSVVKNCRQEYGFD